MAAGDLLRASEALRDGGGAGGVHADRGALPDAPPLHIVRGDGRGRPLRHHPRPHAHGPGKATSQ